MTALSESPFYLGVGFMKTGLTSLLRTMESAGYRSQGKSRALYRAFIAGQYETVMDAYRGFDFACDWPQPYMYRRVFREMPDTRFILTLRPDDAWYESLLRHCRYAHPVMHSLHHIFGRHYPNGFRDEHLAIYRAHNDAVRDFFAAEEREDRLLVIDIREVDALERLKAFVDRPIPLDAFPRENETALRETERADFAFRRRWNDIVQPAYAALWPRLRPEPGRRLATLE
ncbi:MAG: sulfotransferase [Pseudomonadota bacterium]